MIVKSEVKKSRKNFTQNHPELRLQRCVSGGQWGPSHRAGGGHHLPEQSRTRVRAGQLPFTCCCQNENIKTKTEIACYEPSPCYTTDWSTSMSHKGAYNRTFSCMEATYPLCHKEPARSKQNFPFKSP